MCSGSGVVPCFLKFWEQSLQYMVRVVTYGLKQFLVSCIRWLRNVHVFLR